jgi:hypothetical protein
MLAEGDHHRRQWLKCGRIRFFGCSHTRALDLTMMKAHRRIGVGLFQSLDRDSYNSGDWFNRLDFSYKSNNFGVGLPGAEKNQVF